MSHFENREYMRDVVQEVRKVLYMRSVFQAIFRHIFTVGIPIHLKEIIWAYIEDMTPRNRF